MQPRNNRPRRHRAAFINIWVLGGAILLACILTLLMWGTLMLLRPEPIPAAPVTADLNVIHAPTSTTLLATPFSITPTGSAPPSLEPGIIVIGGYVQIQGTGGDGLRLRDRPGLDGKVLLLGSEAEVFQVAEGPVDADGYTWWRLVGPFDETRQGWAVSNYLLVVQNP